MRIAIDLSSTIDGHRLDILEEGKPPYRINPVTEKEAYLVIFNFLKKKADKLPIMTMDVI